MAKIVLVETAKITTGEKPRGQIPQGLLLMANALKKAGHDIEIIDGFIEDPFSKREIKIKTRVVHEFGLSNDRLASLILSKKPDIIGITYMLTIEHEIKKDLVKQLKLQEPSVPIILGGVAASCNAIGVLGGGFPSEKIEGVDFIIMGRGIGLAEKTTIKLIELLTDKEISKKEYLHRLKNLEGIAYLDKKKKIIETPLPILDLRSYSYDYDRSFIKESSNKKFPDRYSELNNPHMGPSPFPQTEIITSNGCPFSCEFCHISSFKQQIKKSCSNHGLQKCKFWDRLPINIIKKEIKKIRDEGYRTISFEDDNFLGHLSPHIDEAIDILSFCCDLKFRAIQFPNGLTIQSLLIDEFRALHKLGEIARSGIILRFAIPIESGSNDTLKRYIKKPHTKEMVLQLLNTLKSSHYLNLSTFQPEAFFIFGAVNSKGKIEPLKNVYESQNFVRFITKEYKIPVSIFGCVPIPPSAHYKKYIQQIEKRKEKVNWPELLFTQVVPLIGQEEKVKIINKVISKLRKQLKKKNLLHIRNAT